MTARLRTPVGEFKPRFDRVVICCNVPPDQLKRKLPVQQLEALTHRFKITKRSGRCGESRILLTCLPDGEALRLLHQHIDTLGKYRVVIVEAAFDVPVFSLAEALRIRDWLAGHLGKLNHQRDYITFIDTNAKGEKLTPEERDRNGYVDEPTIYYEKRGAAHGLKMYIRRQKLAQGEHAEFVIRLEWTSTKSRSVKAHFGGNQLGDLLDADLTAYLHKYLVLEEVDYVRFGKLIRQRNPFRRGHRTSRRRRYGRNPALEQLCRQFDSEDYWAQRRAHLLIQVLEQRHWQRSEPVGNEGSQPIAYREEYRIREKGSDCVKETIREFRPIPEEVWRTSPAQIKGRFRDHFDKLAKKAGRKKDARPRRRNLLTMAKLEACFTPIPLRRKRVRLPKSVRIRL